VKEEMERIWRDGGCRSATHFLNWNAVGVGCIVSDMLSYTKRGGSAFPKYKKLKLMLARFRRREMRGL